MKINKHIFLFVILFGILSSCAFFQTPLYPNFQWPLRKHELTQLFVASKHFIHAGIDLKAPIGTKVYSSYLGRVVYIGNQLTHYGRIVIIEHPRHWASLYAHLKTITVKLNQKIQTGEQIGLSGNTGRTTGPHLHFELIHKRKNVNPLKYLASQ